MREFPSSRSRQEGGLRCDRFRWWGSEYLGQGLESVRASVPLATGGAVHAGLAFLMTQMVEWSKTPAKTPDGWMIDAGVKVALEDYDTKCKERGFQLKELESASQTYNEQRALVEALVRLGGMVVIPRLLETYEVLEVEQEDTGVLVEVDDWTVVWKSIPDALLRNRETGELFLLSWKTTSEYSTMKDDEARVDVQGQSESYALQNRMDGYAGMGKQVPDWYWDQVKHNRPLEIRGIQMVYLIKGQRRREELPDGQWIQKTQSPLIYGVGKDLGGLAPQYATSMKWSCTSPHEGMRPSKWYLGGKCPGMKNHMRGDEWKGFPVWEAMGVKAWIQMIQEGKVELGADSPLESSWAIPMPHYRSPGKLESWVTQATAIEIRRAQSLIRIGDNPQANHLDIAFPQKGMWTGACTNWYRGKCQFFEICHGPDHIAQDPLASGIYQVRTKRDPGKENEDGV